MGTTDGITWTNKSALALANRTDPVSAIQDAARKLVLKAREAGWEGPPFNPVKIVELLGAKISANSNIADARLLATSDGATIEFNPQQPRERVRFSIAHELAHMLFPDWREEVRNRSAQTAASDDWQLEMLCNIAASEFVLPVGSLPAAIEVAPIEELMRERRRYDVSAEAFLIRLAKIAATPISVFFASPIAGLDNDRRYRVDYAVPSPLAPFLKVEGLVLPMQSAARNCTAIGHTDRSVESWFSGSPTPIEFVGIPGYPGSRYPRVAGVVRFASRQFGKSPIRYIHGNILDTLGEEPKIICQLVNDRALKWGGGVAKKFARKYPEAELEYTKFFMSMPSDHRLGRALIVELGKGVWLASIVAQEGFGPSLYPRLRYGALQAGLREVAVHARQIGAGIHMPRIATGAAGGDWGVVEEIIEDELVRASLTVTVYYLPPKREQFELFN
ncbi:ImmA/IrrE family metallo-endopeptidase [Novosphingobium sp.]|uniref:ImmA/IrrE family metallo-endopeptidase n=1 Tax=Novosphingobium sp. TaxID=1874826 RepID=UPI003B51990E